MNRCCIKRWLVISFAIVSIGCSLGSRKVKLGEQFTLRPKEKVVVAGTGLTIRLDEVGHQTFSEPQPRPLSSSYVVLTVTAGGAAPRSVSISVGESETIGGYTITVNSAYPFRSDNGPRCGLTVTAAAKK